MNEIQTITQQLPDTIEDLSKFVLVGKAKLQGYMMKLQTINRLSVAQEVRDQTLREAQEISTALIAAEQRIGELLLSIPKASGGVNQYNKEEKAERTAKSKSEIIAEQGYERHEASDYQQMAKHPEVVQKVLDDALANGDIVTKASVMREIGFYKNRIKTLEKKAANVRADAYNELMGKYTKKCNEALKLRDELQEMKSASMEGLENANLSENIFYFCAICNNFISNVGGLVWLTERIADMPKRERDMYLKAARAFNDWAIVFKDNLERSLNEEKRTDTGVPLLTD